jgi:hypothetical protein
MLPLQFPKFGEAKHPLPSSSTLLILIDLEIGLCLHQLGGHRGGLGWGLL